MTLSDQDLAILAFERSGRRHTHRKLWLQEMHDRFGFDAMGYITALCRLADDEEAETIDPLTVHRLRRDRSSNWHD